MCNGIRDIFRSLRHAGEKYSLEGALGRTHLEMILEHESIDARRYIQDFSEVTRVPWRYHGRGKHDEIRLGFDLFLDERVFRLDDQAFFIVIIRDPGNTSPDILHAEFLSRPIEKFLASLPYRP